MPKRKKKTARKTTSRKKKASKSKEEQELYWVTTGIVLILLTILVFSRVGWLGMQAANLIRFFFGNSYLLAGALLGLLGLVMVIYGQPPYFKIKRTSGLILAFFGLLLIQSGSFFNGEEVNSNFINSFLTTIGREFARASVTENVGGGIFGALGCQIINPLLGKVGINAIGVCLIPIGILMFFDVKYRTVVELFQKVSQSFINKNKEAGSKLKDKYSEIRDNYEQQRSNRAQLTDPLKNSNTVFPNVNDFDDEKQDTQTPIETVQPTEEEQEDEEIQMPEVITPETPKSEETQETAPSFYSDDHEDADELPKSHAFADEDRKVIQELSDVDHGELKLDTKVNTHYKKPPLTLLDPIKNTDQSDDRQLIQKNTQILQSTFKSFGVKVIIKKAILGPTITRYEVQPAVGVKVSRIVNLADDLALALAAKDIRIEAPIPGKPYIGIEVPNRSTSVVSFKDVMEHQSKKAKEHPMIVPLGKDVAGQVVSADLAKMPHLLIAGSTGSGKSVAINTILTSILMKSKPEEIKLVLIDPKMVELSVYNDIPHLLIPVVTDSKLAINSLHKVVKEMERRYKLFAASGARNMGEYNSKVEKNNQDKTKPAMQKLPYILVVVDELSDLMMVGGHDVEGAIVRLGQMARAAGIHMILATQRPSVDVISGLIKANVPSRISFAVSSSVDSRTILDQVGAEKLLGRGDMLYMPIGASKPERIQGAYISSEEVEKVIDWVKDQQKPEYDQTMIPQKGGASAEGGSSDEPDDEFYSQAVELVRKQQTASVSMLQRRFRIGYNRAARIVDEMEARGIVGPSEGSKPRQVLLPPEKDEKNANN